MPRTPDLKLNILQPLSSAVVLLVLPLSLRSFLETDSMMNSRINPANKFKAHLDNPTDGTFALSLSAMDDRSLTMTAMASCLELRKRNWLNAFLCGMFVKEATTTTVASSSLRPPLL